MRSLVLQMVGTALTLSVFGLSAGGALAQFAPGQPVEYSRTGGNWQHGVVIRALPGEAQWLIHEEPSQFFPEGPEAAYSAGDLRPRQPDPVPAGNDNGGADTAFQPGQKIEYSTGFPPVWVPGDVVGMLPNGTQVLIREAPSKFFPEGFQRAYTLDEVRPSQGGAAPAPQPDPVPQPQVDPAPQPNAPLVVADLPDQPGLLGEEDILAYARQALGPDPWGNPNREQALAQIRDYIKSHGVNFEGSLDFDNRLGEVGANSVHNTSAIGANYGANPELADYFGTFTLASHDHRSQSIHPVGDTHVIVATPGMGGPLGSLTINPDGTYAWDALGNGKLIHDQWREATAGEKQAWEGGPSIWLLRGRDGQDYQVRMNRQKGWRGWIDVGQGMGRVAVQNGVKM